MKQELFNKAIQEIYFGDGDPLTKEKQMRHLIIVLIQVALSEAFRYLDTLLEANMKADGYVRTQKVDRTVDFLFASVTYTRSRWKKGKEVVYPLDDLLNILPRHRFSLILEMTMANLAPIASLRKVAESIRSVAPVSVSKDTIRRTVCEFGEKAAAKQVYEEEYEWISKKEKPEILGIQGDGLRVKLQTKAEVDVANFVLQEVINGKKRLITFSDANYQQALCKVSNYIQNHYDLSETVVITNSDGGRGYTCEPFFELSIGAKKHEHFLDRYHLYKKLKERIFVEELYEPICKAVSEYSLEKLEPLLEELRFRATTEKEVEHAEKLKDYLNRHWKDIRPYYMRDLPKRIEGILGTMESYQRELSYRLKGQGKSWGSGLNGMIQLIIARFNHTFEEIFLEQWKLTFYLDNRLRKEGNSRRKGRKRKDVAYDYHEEPVWIKRCSVNLPKRSCRS